MASKSFKSKIAQRPKGKKGRVQAPALGTVVVDDITAEIEYDKSDTGLFVVPLADIPYTVGSTFQRCYDMCWKMPDYGVSQQSGAGFAAGPLCNLGRTQVILKNVSSETISVRLQRPMGFRNSPGSLALWEPCRKKELTIDIRPHQQQMVTYGNGSTSHMVPRQCTVDGVSCIDLFAFTLSREPRSDTGVDLTKPSTHDIGIEMTTKLEYRAANDAMGKTKNFVLRVLPSDAYLDHVNMGPPPTVRVADITCTDRQGNTTACHFATLGDAGYDKDRVSIAFLNVEGGFASEINLDKQTVYMLPQMLHTTETEDAKHTNVMGCVAHNTNGRIHAKKGVNAWCACTLAYYRIDVDQTGKKLTTPQFGWSLKVMNIPGNPVLPPNTVLRPMLSYSGDRLLFLTEDRVMVRSRRSAPRARVGCKLLDKQQFSALDAPAIVEHIIDSLTTIIKVVKVTAEIAGAIGLLTVNIPTPPQRVTSTCEQLGRPDSCTCKDDVVSCDSCLSNCT